MDQTPHEILTETMNTLKRQRCKSVHVAACVCGKCKHRADGGDIRCANRLAYRMVEMARTVIQYKGE